MTPEQLARACKDNSILMMLLERKNISLETLILVIGEMITKTDSKNDLVRKYQWLSASINNGKADPDTGEYPQLSIEKMIQEVIAKEISKTNDETAA